MKYPIFMIQKIKFFAILNKPNEKQKQNKKQAKTIMNTLNQENSTTNPNLFFAHEVETQNTRVTNRRPTVDTHMSVVRPIVTITYQFVDAYQHDHQFNPMSPLCYILMFVCVANVNCNM